MQKSISFIIFLTSFFISAYSHAVSGPNWALTPGALCTSNDPDFQGFDYPEKIARCNRNISINEKQIVAKNYGGLAEKEWSKYEFDHLLPLCAGGSNSLQNLWPQPIAEAHLKDVLENEICLAMRAGTMSQATAVQKVRDWFTSNTTTFEANPQLETINPPGNNFYCRSAKSTGAHITRENDGTLTKASIRLIEADGEHEVISISSPIKPLKVMTANPKLSGYFRYSLNPKEKDRFEIFLPTAIDLRASGGQFVAYFKFSFEGNYPTLETLNCQPEATYR